METVLFLSMPMTAGDIFALGVVVGIGALAVAMLIIDNLLYRAGL